jgi:hypothetical protein
MATWFAMQLAQPANTLVLESLARSGAGKPEIEGHDAVPAADAYLRCGCHPDVVERVWDQLGAALPQDCRRLVHGTPALVHPNGLILAVGMGTQYGLRILLSDRDAASQAGAKTTTVWSGGGGMDIRATYGADWVFGAWLAAEPAWCRAVFDSPERADEALTELVEPQDPAAVAAQEQTAHRAGLEQRAASGDLGAAFALSQVLLNTSFKERSLALLERAGSLLSTAAAGGHPQAMAMLPAWPHLEAEARRKIPK